MKLFVAVILLMLSISSNADTNIQKNKILTNGLEIDPCSISSEFCTEKVPSKMKRDLNNHIGLEVDPCEIAPSFCMEKI